MQALEAPRGIVVRGSRAQGACTLALICRHVHVKRMLHTPTLVLDLLAAEARPWAQGLLATGHEQASSDCNCIAPPPAAVPLHVAYSLVNHAHTPKTYAEVTNVISVRT